MRYLFWRIGFGALLGLMLLSVAAGHAATLVADYRFEHSLKSAVAGAPDVEVEGVDFASFATSNLFGSSRTVLDINVGAGLRIDTTGLITSNRYTVVVLLALSSTANYGRVFDCQDPTDGQGWFVNSGQMLFLPDVSSGPAVIQAGQFIQLAMVKSGDSVRAYADGAKQFDVTDTANRGRIGLNGIVHFLRQANGSYAPGGQVARIRLYDGALTDAEVAALAPLVPAAPILPSGAVAVADYRFESSLKSSTPGAADLVFEGADTAEFVSDTVFGTNRTVIEFGPGSGFRLDAGDLTATGKLDRDRYTVVALFEFANVRSYQRILDARDAPDANGFFFLEGQLKFNPFSPAPPPGITENKYVQVALVDDGLFVRGYVDGVRLIDGLDLANLGAVGSSNVLHFFRQGDGNYAPGGRVARIRVFNGALTDTEVAALSPLVPTSPVPPSGAGVVADYRFEESLKSSVGNARDLTLEGSAIARFVADNLSGTARTVLEFGQSGGFRLDVADLTATGVLNRDRYSVVALFKFANVRSYQRILDARDAPDANGFFFLEGQLKFNPYPQAPPPGITENKYVQVALVDDGLFVRGYVDGVRLIDRVDLPNFGAIGSSNVLHFFRQGDGNYAPGGRVARIRIFNGALTDADVASLAPLVPPSIPPPSGAHLVADYKFQNNFESEVAGAPSIEPSAVDKVSFVDAADLSGRRVLKFDPGQGLRLQTKGLIDPDHYTMVIGFAFDSTGSYNRILDPKDPSETTAWFLLNGSMAYHPVYSVPEPAIVAGEFSEVTLVNDGGHVLGFASGSKQFELLDPNHLAAIGTNGLVNFFRNANGPPYAPGGRVTRIRIYNGALNEVDVAALVPSVPGPDLPLPPAGANVALEFSGGYLTVPNTGEVKAPFTVEFWGFPTGGGTLGVLGSRQPSESGFDLKFSGTGGLHGDIGNGNNGWLTTGADYQFPQPVTNWIHVAYVVRTNSFEIVINGQSVLTNGWSETGLPVLYDANHQLRIGNSYPGELMQGQLDEIRIWNIDRTAAQIKADYRTILTGMEPGLVNYYRFSEGRGRIAADSAAEGGVDHAAFVAAGHSLRWVTTGLYLETSTCVPAPAGLVAWLRGEGNAADDLGNHPGTLRGKVTFPSGRVGQAFGFNGTDSSVDLGAWFDLQTFSIAFWVKEGDSQQQNADIFDNNHTVSRSFVLQYLNSGHSYVWGEHPGLINFDLTPNSWQHLVITREPGFVTRIYLDGNQVGALTNSSSINYDGSQFLRLAKWGGGGREWNGLLDEFDVYNRALTPAEVGSLYTSGVFGKCKAEPPPDLVITQVTVPTVGAIGQTIHVGFTVLNQGSGPAVGRWTQGLFLEEGTNVESRRILGEVPYAGSLAPGESVTLDQSIILPTRFAGTFRVGVTADSGSQVAESVEDNNTSYAPGLFQLSAPDLVLSSQGETASGFFGRAFHLAWTVRNSGNTAALSAWTDEVYLSRISNSIDSAFLLRAEPNSSLGVNATYSRSLSVNLPLSADLPPGQYYIVHRANADSGQGESRSDNNIASTSVALSLPPLPDIAVVAADAPLMLFPNRSVTVTWAVTNRGSASASGVWSEVVGFLPAVGNEVVFGEFRYTNNLTTGGILLRTQLVAIPESLPAGPWRMAVHADSRLEIVESNEANNSFTAVLASTVPAVLTLATPVTDVSEEDPAFTVVVTRNGDLAGALTVTITNSAPNELAVSNSISIPAGQASIGLLVRPLHDGLVDGPQFVTLSASHPTYQSASLVLTVRDTDVPTLSLRFGSATVREGAAVPLTISRSGETNQAVTVILNPTDPTQLEVPQSVVIPANASSVTVNVIAREDTVIESTQTHGVEAEAAGYKSTSATIDILDNDAPSVSLQLASHRVSEGAGPQATVARLTRSPVTGRALVIELETEPAGVATVPDRVVINGNDDSIVIPVGVIDNSIVDGSRTVSLRVFVLTSDGQRLPIGAGDTLEVQDDDGPTLKINLSRDAVSEGANPAATATIIRNTATNGPLAVKLASSDTTELTVPPTVVIPAGASSVAVDLASLLDGVTDGNQPVIVTASATGYTPGSAVLVVTDVDLPDLVITELVAPTDGLSEADVAFRYRVENRGIAASASNFVTRVYLTTNAYINPLDAVASEFRFEGTLAVGQFFEQTAQVRLPARPGQYWLVAVTDPLDTVKEILEDNNQRVTAAPILVSPAYSATVQTSVTAATAGSLVPLSGKAIRTGSSLPAANVPITIHIYVRGTHRTLGVTTDSGGNFTAGFTPLLNEAGIYRIGAAHPGFEDVSEQDRFTLFGARIAPPESELTLIQGAHREQLLELRNLGETPLTGLTASVLDAPPNLSVTATVPAVTQDGDTTNALTIGITANGATPSLGEIRVRVTAAGGVSAEATLLVHVQALHSHLVAIPESLLETMISGQQKIVEFDVVNDGGNPTGPLTITVPSAPWLAVGTTQPLAPLPPGGSNRITLLLTPSQELPLGPYRSSVVIGDGVETPINVPFEFLAASEGKGHLRVIGVDEFTYYAAGGPRVTNATVVVRDALSHLVITNGITGPGGDVLFRDLTEGYYDVEMSADTHSASVGTLLLRGSRTNDFELFLSRQTVTYRWSVIPATVEDRTRITIETEFETFVPIPVVTMTPEFIDLTDFSGVRTQINLTIHNDGLVAAQDYSFELPEHPDFVFETLVTDVGAIPAMGEVIVPMTIRRISTDAGASGLAPGTRKRSARLLAGNGSGPCSVSVRGCWKLPCGGRKNKYCTPSVVGGLGNCGGGGSGGGFGGGGGGGGGGRPWAYSSGAGGGGSYYPQGTPTPFTPPFTFSPPKICDCDPDDFDEKCVKIPISSSVLSGALDALAGTLNKVPSISGVEIKAEGKVELCICCSKSEGPGFKASGGGSINFKGKLTFPVGGKKLLKKSFTRGDFVFEIEGELGCSYEQSFEATGTVSGKTECQLKNLEVKGSLSLDLPATFSCGIQPHVTVRKGSSKILDGNIGASAEIKYGVSAKVEYTQDSKSTHLSGEICGKGLTVKFEMPVKIPGIVDETLKYEATLVEEACLDLGSPAAATIAAEIIEHAHQTSRAIAAQSPGRTAHLASASGADEPGVCAKVRLQIDQDLVMARNAFKATLELGNSSPTTVLSNLNVTLFVEDEFGQPSTELFGVRPPELQGLSAVDGTGSLAANATGSAIWTLIPTSEAAPFGPTRYGIGGVLSYWQDGHSVTIPLFAAPITVYPDPRLVVQYFHERDVFADDPFTRDRVEPSVPFNLAVMVQNRGRGTAQNVKLISSQPKIIENEKGLLIDFKIIGSEVEGSGQSPSLTAVFGEIPPGTNRIGRWLLTSTLQGLFTDYKATFEHLDSLGKTNLSLLESVTIHEMIHLVQAGGSFEDGRPDFLVNDIRDPGDHPDTLYLSSGATQHVEVVREALFDHTPSVDQPTVQLHATMPHGWTYLRLPDPSDGKMILSRVVRSDGVGISLGTNVWTTDRSFIGQGQRPVLTNQFHLLDYDSPGIYSLTFVPLPPADSLAPVSVVKALPAASYPQFTVSWEGADEIGGSGLRSFDIYASDNGSAFSPWLHDTKLSSALYPGESGHAYAFYSIAVDAQGNRETPPLDPDAQTVVSLANSAPVFQPLNSVEVDEGAIVSVSVAATDGDAGQRLNYSLAPGAPPGVTLDPATGLLTWPTGEADGPGTNVLRVIVRDNGSPSLSATGTLRVVVREVNDAPVLAQISNRTINELQTLSLAAKATDSDLPAQMLTYRLLGTPPAGVALTPQGLFTWTPNATQGPSTNPFTLVVRDNGSPALEATQHFAITVRDSRGDFSLGFGRTNLSAGQSGILSLNLDSGLDLSDVSFTLVAGSSGLFDLALSPANGSVGSASLAPAGANRFILRLSAAAGQVLQGIGEFGRMTFATHTNHPSAIVSLLPQDIDGHRISGITVRGSVLAPGRVIVLNREPLLVAEPGEPRTLSSFARPGSSLALDRTNRLGTSTPWTFVEYHAQTNLADTILVVGGEDSVFYRSRDIEVDPPIFATTGFGPLLMLGLPGKTYTVQCSTNLALGQWIEVQTVQFTNAWRWFSPTITAPANRSYRITRP